MSEATQSGSNASTWPPPALEERLTNPNPDVSTIALASKLLVVGLILFAAFQCARLGLWIYGLHLAEIGMSRRTAHLAHSFNLVDLGDGFTGNLAAITHTVWYWLMFNAVSTREGSEKSPFIRTLLVQLPYVKLIFGYELFVKLWASCSDLESQIGRRAASPALIKIYTGLLWCALWISCIACFMRIGLGFPLSEDHSLKILLLGYWLRFIEIGFSAISLLLYIWPTRDMTKAVTDPASL